MDRWTGKTIPEKHCDNCNAVLGIVIYGLNGKELCGPCLTAELNKQESVLLPDQVNHAP